MGLTTWLQLGNEPMQTADGTADANSLALTDISPAVGAGALIVPANAFQPGKGILVKAFGKWSNTATPTLKFDLMWGGQAGVSIGTTGAITTTTAAANWLWQLEALITCRTAGATGTVLCSGHLHLATSLTAISLFPIPITALATTTVDTTVAKTLSLAATWSAASASNTITCLAYAGVFLDF